MFQQNISILFFIIVNVSASHKKSLRILYGDEFKPDEFPYVVTLKYYTIYVSCTGSILNENWGVTAGHCRPNPQRNNTISIWHSSFRSIDMFSKIYPIVVEWKVHPAYRLFNLDEHPDLIVDNDISLFRIEPSLKLSRYARLSSLDRGSLGGLPVVYIGGGKTNNTSSRRVEQFNMYTLKKGEGVIVACNKYMTTKSKHILCISPKCDVYLQSPWHGDSGGPLIYNDQVVGVCSFGSIKGRIIQNAFVPISPYINWISDVIQIKG
ncbi:unnamed protein product [Spodoptera littoralis]|uniref:Peptidase S1 domain-containing protein n=1 Tax=Spodoptera littoralis TaxID=7109 RepID=A0A9P0IJV6_SPOLI|nr:unnamed protein product [Spodoptera littoralis]CAH1647349.1 unnamed protein product [Spodoptera littoralis]